MGAGSQQAGSAGGSLRSAQVILGVPSVPGAHLTPTLRPHPDPSSSCSPAETDTRSSFRRGLSSGCQEVTGRISPPRGQPSGLYWPREDAPPSGTGRPRGTGRKGGDPTTPDSSQPAGVGSAGDAAGLPSGDTELITLCPGTPGEDSRNHTVSLGLIPVHPFSAQNPRVGENRDSELPPRSGPASALAEHVGCWQSGQLTEA